MIKKINVTQKDKDILAGIHYDPMKDLVDEPDYTAVLINKPWGYEYLLFKNRDVAVWILHISRDFQTSLHCHPNKKTSLTVLEGEVEFNTLHETIRVRPGEGLLIDKGVFHSTRAVSDGGAIIMETETPVYKHDLVRFNDNYGRARQGYEGKTFHVPLDDWQYPKTHMFHKPNERYNTEKRIGVCSLMVIKCSAPEDLMSIIRTANVDLVGVLKGELFNSGSPLLRYGDVAALSELRARPEIRLDGEVELLLIKNNPI
jgi:mannose-6-phosphate isomerase-like protein (cupin superfamily)